MVKIRVGEPAITKREEKQILCKKSSVLCSSKSTCALPVRVLHKQFAHQFLLVWWRTADILYQLQTFPLPILVNLRQNLIMQLQKVVKHL